ncbi:MAG: DUF2391 family protein [Gammaproteobacteria bacterium]
MRRRINIKDFSEIVLGSVLLAFPVAITEEVWNMGKELSLFGMVMLIAISLAAIAWFAYHNYYQSVMSTHKADFVMRVFAIYGITLIVAALILTLFNQFPLMSDWAVAIKRMVIVALPASFSATVVDSIKD